MEVAHRRTVRSYVLREGRLTPGQTQALERLWPRFGVDWQPGTPLDLPSLFGKDRPVSLEIGFGSGETLLALAEGNPACGFLGVEVHRPGIGRLLRALEAQELSNVRVLRQDAVALLHDGLAEASLAAVYLLFPDPWPKQRHHKRRILTAALVAELARVLQPGGLFHAASDWPDYAEQMLAELERASPWFENLAGSGQFTPRPSWRPPTRFEQRGERLGHPVRDLSFRRR